MKLKVLAILTLVSMLTALYMIFLYAPREALQGDAQRIFYIHVPLAISGYVSAFLLFIGVILSLYLGAVANWFEHKLRTPPGLALVSAIVASVGALVLLGLILVPPVVTQTEELIRGLPTVFGGWEQGIDNLSSEPLISFGDLAFL